MSSGVKGAAASGRVSIPSSVKKTIDDIKEIIGQKHSEDEIYAMLKECSMDPNETAQKLLLLDTFHEVKKKRDRRKENLNKEPAESRWKPGSQAQANRVGRRNYSSRRGSHGAGGGRSLSAVTESSTRYVSEKLVSKAPLATAQDVKKNRASSVARPTTDISYGPSGVSWQSINSLSENHTATGLVNQPNETGLSSITKLEEPLSFSSALDSNESLDALGTRDMQHNEMLGTNNSAISIPSAPAILSSDPVLLPSQNLPLPSSMGAARDEVGNQHTPVELIEDNPTDRKSDSPLQQKMPNDFQGVGKTQYLGSLQTAFSAIGVASVSSPSTNYNGWSQVIGPQNVGPGKEWKPKSTDPSDGQGANTAASSEVSTISVGSHPEMQHTILEKATPELQRNLEELNISSGQHVIIPNHLQVPEVGKLGFYFGSFDGSFGLDTAHNGSIERDKSTLLSESSEATDEPANENTETKHPDHVRSPSQGPEHFSSSEVEVSSSITPEYGEFRQEVAPGSHQHPVVETSSNYNYDLMPSVLSGQLTPFESLESQAHDVPRLPGYVVQQSFDPMRYYSQFYQSGVDGDGRVSPLHSAGATNKYNGNAALVSAQASQPSQEGGAPLVLSTASPVPLVTQAAGVMQSSVTATQQPLPVFRQPTGIHLSHYPPFVPYAPYFSPFYVPPPAIHQFLSNGAFHQQPHGANLYPTPPETTARYSVSQHKQGSNTGNSTQIGVPGNYGQYGLAVGNYNSGSTTAAVTTMLNEDSAASQVKETNIYVSAQQSEGFTPTQPGHRTFTSIFHPGQAVTVATMHPLLQQSQAITNPADMVGPTSGVYQQQQQHTLHNWPGNY
ncbi:hypothetical protein CDL12_06949 [Handroanthus impetiginosus]|uniref:GBF-interacting protein 1 N-terminal domain-containing protein n=1 Tax=Handroanthus impetiginosus TaxID=429701 RepID=A0A2G9HS48_9LAMI|nr:hypothetical protein CDL12_06949 [Handroanthus impetiginosus]